MFRIKQAFLLAVSDEFQVACNIQAQLISLFFSHPSFISYVCRRVAKFHDIENSVKFSFNKRLIFVLRILSFSVVSFLCLQFVLFRTVHFPIIHFMFLLVFHFYPSLSLLFDIKKRYSVNQKYSIFIPLSISYTV